MVQDVWVKLMCMYVQKVVLLQSFGMVDEEMWYGVWFLVQPAVNYLWLINTLSKNQKPIMLTTAQVLI